MLWKSGIKKGIEGELFEILESLHRAGLARNYTNYGEIEYTTEWSIQ